MEVRIMAQPEQDLEALRQKIADAYTKTHGAPIYPLLLDALVRLVQAEVAAAQELFWLRGYEAGFAVGSGNVKGEPWAVVEQRLLKNRPELAKLVNPPQQPPTEGGSDGDKQ
jgi:hypothetical protein